MAYPGHQRGDTADYGGRDQQQQRGGSRGYDQQGGQTPRGGYGQQQVQDDYRPPQSGGGGRDSSLPPVQEIIEMIREKCASRGPGGFKGFSRMFRLYDRDRSFNLSREELEIGLSRYGIDVTPTQVQALFKYFDTDRSGTVNLQEIMVAVRPAMSKCRQELVKKAFVKLDKTGDGVITVEDLKGVYKVDEHPKYKSGEWTKQKCFQQFLDTFQINDDEKVTREEFNDYYLGVSVNIDRDVYFDYMMRQTWKNL